jgi:threonine dehydratase
MELAVTLEDIRAAQERMRPMLVPTPCRRSSKLSALTGSDLYLKFENLQFTASFKERGALNRLLRLSDAERRRGVYAVSDGNHGLAVAYHARRLGIPVTIVMSRHTPFIKLEHTREEGAEIIQFGESLQEAYQHGRSLCAERGLIFVHPYDDPDVIAGQGTIALEMLEAYPDIDVLVVQIGGGGLIAGVSVAAKGLKPSIEVIGVQAECHPSMIAGLKGEIAGYRGNTIAEGIALKSPGVLTLEIVRALVEEIMLVSEADLERAMGMLLDFEKTVTEGAGAAGLAAVLSQTEQYRGRKVGIILSGGNIDPRLLSSVIMRELVRGQRIVTLRIPIADKPGSLSGVTDVIAQQGGNILDIAHRKLSTEAPARSASLEVSFEALDSVHAQHIVAKMREAGFEISVTTH